MARTYRYYFKRHDEVNGFDATLVATVKEFPPKELLDAYAKIIEGTHDFSTFTGSGDLCPSKMRDIYESYWRLEEDRWGGELLSYTITGNAFLYKMVRPWSAMTAAHGEWRRRVPCPPGSQGPQRGRPHRQRLRSLPLPHQL